MGKTKLTRKEIMGEDPVHDGIVYFLELVGSQRRNLALAAVGIALAGAGLYFALQYLQKRESRAQQQLAKGIEFFHAQTDPTALDDPYGKGPQPVFRTEEDRFKAAAKEFSAVISDHASSKLAVIARYYLGLCQINLGQSQEAVRTLEGVRDNSKDRSIGYLGKRVLTKLYAEAENHKAAKEVLEGMIQDPQCEIPKAELKLQLARTLIRMGKKEEAVKTLKEARDAHGNSIFQSMMVQELNRLGESSAVPAGGLESVTIRP